VRCSGGLLALFLLASGSCSTPPLEKAGDDTCRPSFREVGSEQITSELAYWNARFSVALIGCESDLLAIREPELERMRAELASPAEWSNFLLFSEAPKAEFRRSVVQRLNRQLGREAISDILFHDIQMFDHSAR